MEYFLDTACDGQFQLVTSGGNTHGCLARITVATNTWLAARTACLALGADLANPNHFQPGSILMDIVNQLPGWHTFS